MVMSDKRQRSTCKTCWGWGYNWTDLGRASGFGIVKDLRRCSTCGGHGTVEEDGEGCLGIFVGFVVIAALVAVILVLVL